MPNSKSQMPSEKCQIRIRILTGFRWWQVQRALRRRQPRVRCVTCLYEACAQERRGKDTTTENTHKCTNAKCTNAKCTNAQMHEGQMHKYTNAQMHECQMHKYTNAEYANTQMQMHKYSKILTQMLPQMTDATLFKCTNANSTNSKPSSPTSTNAQINAT